MAINYDNSTNAPKISLENPLTALVAGDDLGTIDYVSNDISTFASGPRIRLLGEVNNTTGAGVFTVQIAGSSTTSFSNSLKVQSTLTTFNQSIAINGNFVPQSYLQQSNVSGGSVNYITGVITMLNTDTQMDIDLSIYTSQLQNVSVYHSFVVQATYDSGAGTYAYLFKNWQQKITWNGTTLAIVGANLIGTVYNSDATNFPAGAINAGKVLTTIVTNTTYYLRLLNRTTPAATSTTFYQYHLTAHIF